jgi:hypothetical protein
MEMCNMCFEHEKCCSKILITKYCFGQKILECHQCGELYPTNQSVDYWRQNEYGYCPFCGRKL